MVTKRPVFDRMTAGHFTVLRHLTGLSVDELAQELDVNPRTVRAWGAGRDPIPERIEQEMNTLLDRQNKLADEIITSGEPVILRNGERGKPSGWWLGIAARVLNADPTRPIRWWDELTPTAKTLEWILHNAGITEVLRSPKPGPWTVQTPSYRVKCRSLLTRGERIAQAPVERQERMRQEVEVWQGGDFDAIDTRQLRMVASSTPNTSWTRWVQQHADQIPDGWEPVEVVPNPHNQALVWAY